MERPVSAGRRRNRRPQNVRDDRPRATFADAYRVAVDARDNTGDNLAQHRGSDQIERARFLNSRELQPYPITTVIDLLGVLDGPDPNPVPVTQWTAVNHAPHAFKKSKYKKPKLTERDIAKDANWIYIPHDSMDPKKRLLQHEAVNSLNLLLDHITHGKLQRQSLEMIKATLDPQALRRLQEHQSTLGIADRRCFVQCIAHWYRDSHDEGIQKRNHSLDPLYFHPADSLSDLRPDYRFAEVMKTFTENNVNSWSVADLHDPSIVYDSNGQVRYLDPTRPNIPFDERKMLEFPAQTPRLPQQPGIKQAMEVMDSLFKQSNLNEERYQEWVQFGKEQIKVLGEEKVTNPGGGGTCILRPIGKPPMEIIMQVKDDPERVIQRMMSTGPWNEMYAGREEDLRLALKEELIWQLDTPGCPYWKWNVWKRDLELRALRRDISDKLKCRWKFFLQHLAPKGLTPVTTHCDHPCCEYHEHRMIPPGTFRLNFLDTKIRRADPFWLPNTKDEGDTPARADDNQMWFCLSCIEGLFNGEGLITELWYDESNPTDEHENAKSANDMMRMEVSTQPELLWSDPPSEEIEAQWQQRIDEATASAFRKAAENSPRKRRAASEMSVAASAGDANRKGSKRSSAVRELEDDDENKTPGPVRKVSKTDLADEMDLDRTPNGFDHLSISSVPQISTSMQGVIQRNNEQNGGADLINFTSPDRTVYHADQIRNHAGTSFFEGASRNAPPIIPRPDGSIPPPKDWPTTTTSRTVIRLHVKPPKPVPPPEMAAKSNLRLPVLPFPPRLTPQPIPEGMSAAIFLLYDKIEPELRYTQNTYMTLSPHENHALTMWKNMCMRKCIFDVPQNRKFFLQECCGANPNGDGTDSGYDFHNYWGPDCLDEETETYMGFIIEGRAVRNLAAVGLRTDGVGDVFIPDPAANQVNPMIRERQQPERPIRVMLEDVSHLDRTEKSPSTGGGTRTSSAHHNRRIRVVKPLSEILTALSKREQLAWKKVGYVPGHPWDGFAKPQRQGARINMYYRGTQNLDFPPIEYRDWPARSIWQKELMKARIIGGLGGVGLERVKEERCEMDVESDGESSDDDGDESEDESEKEN